MKLRYNNQEIDLVIYNSFFKRFMGIMFKKKKIDYALCFPRCNSIHTFFCKQNIDIIMTNKENKILYFRRNVKPNKVVIYRESSIVYEMPCNYFDNLEINTFLERREDL